MASNETCCTEDSSTRADFSSGMAESIHVKIFEYPNKQIFICRDSSSDVYSVSTWYPASIPEIFAELTNEITRHIKQAQEVMNFTFRDHFPKFSNIF